MPARCRAHLPKRNSLNEKWASGSEETARKSEKHSPLQDGALVCVEIGKRPRQREVQCRWQRPLPPLLSSAGKIIVPSKFYCHFVHSHAACQCGGCVVIDIERETESRLIGKAEKPGTIGWFDWVGWPDSNYRSWKLQVSLAGLEVFALWRW